MKMVIETPLAAETTKDRTSECQTSRFFAVARPNGISHE